MSLIVAFITVFLVVFSYLRNKDLLNPIVLMNGFWFIIIFLNIINLYKYRQINSYIYLIIMIGVISFSIGGSLPVLNIKHHKRVLLSSMEVDPIIQKIYFVIPFISLISLDVVAAGFLVSGYTISDIRYSLNDFIFSNDLINIVFKFITYPMVVSYIIICVSKILVTQRFSISIIVRPLILTIMDFLVLGDRLLIYIWLISGLVIYFTVKKNNNNRKIIRKTRKYVGFIVIITFAFLILRGSTFKNLLYTIYTYLSGGVVYFSQNINRINESAGSTILFSSYQGLIRPFMAILDRFNIHIKQFDIATEFLLDNNNISILLSNDSSDYFNYFTTAFAYFYYDFKIFGVILHSLLWGVLCKSAYYKFRNRLNERNACIFIFYIISIALSVMDYAFVEVSFSMGLLYCLFAYIFSKIIKKRGNFNEK